MEITPAVARAAGVAAAFPAVVPIAAPIAGAFIRNTLYTRYPMPPVITVHNMPSTIPGTPATTKEDQVRFAPNGNAKNGINIEAPG